MSDENTKFKHSKRIQKTKRHIDRQVNHYRMSWGGDYKMNWDVKQPHRLAKRNAFNCGNPNCFMCANPRKVFKEKTLKEKAFDETINWE